MDSANGDDAFRNQLEEAARDSLRKELSNYLESLPTKIDSEGNTLVSVPSNFDAIADAMSREDLVSNSEAPWSKYLLASKFEEDLDREYGGRYKNFDDKKEVEDVKLMKGLAEMQMLDNQLRALSKKEAHLKVAPAWIDSQQPTPLITGRLGDVSYEPTPRSTMPKNLDATFLTRTRQSSRAGTVVDEDQMQSVASTSRGPSQPNSPSVQSPSHRAKSAAASPSNAYSDGRAAETTASARSASGATIGSGKGKAVKKQQQPREDMPKRDAIKLQMLLDSDDIEPYALTDAERKRIEEIDNQLLSLRPSSSRLLLPPYSGDDERASKEGREQREKTEKDKEAPPKKINYLAEQREQRAKKVYEEKIDSLLSQCRSRNIDLSGLVDGIDSENVDILSRYRSASSGIALSAASSKPSTAQISIEELPEVVDIKPDRKISVADLREVIQQCIAVVSRVNSSVSLSYAPSNGSIEGVQDSKHDFKDVDVDALGNDDSHPELAPSQSTLSISLNLSASDRQAIDRLLSQYRADIVQLGTLRHQKRLGYGYSNARASLRSTGIAGSASEAPAGVGDGYGDGVCEDDDDEDEDCYDHEHRRDRTDGYAIAIPGISEMLGDVPIERDEEEEGDQKYFSSAAYGDYGGYGDNDSDADSGKEGEVGTGTVAVGGGATNAFNPNGIGTGSGIRKGPATSSVGARLAAAAAAAVARNNAVNISSDRNAVVVNSDRRFLSRDGEAEESEPYEINPFHDNPSYDSSGRPAGGAIRNPTNYELAQSGSRPGSTSASLEGPSIRFPPIASAVQVIRINPASTRIESRSNPASNAPSREGRRPRDGISRASLPEANIKELAAALDNSLHVAGTLSGRTNGSSVSSSNQQKKKSAKKTKNQQQEAQSRMDYISRPFNPFKDEFDVDDVAAAGGGGMGYSGGAGATSARRSIGSSGAGRASAGRAEVRSDRISGSGSAPPTARSRGDFSRGNGNPLSLTMEGDSGSYSGDGYDNNSAGAAIGSRDDYGLAVIGASRAAVSSSEGRKSNLSLSSSPRKSPNKQVRI